MMYTTEETMQNAILVAQRTAEDIKQNAYERSETIIKDAVKNHFRAEFINRLDDIIVFNSLTKEDCYDIADISLNELILRLKESNIYLTVDNSAVEYIIDNEYSEEFGARAIKRAIAKHIENVLSDAIIDGTIQKNDKIKVIYNGKTLEYIKI